MQFINTLNGFLWSYVLIGLLLASGIYYTVRSGFAQFKLFGNTIKLILGKVPAMRDGQTATGNQVSAFQAFCISISSHVGTGNLAGVAIAVVLGGPGALFWMWITALIGCATSLIENTLAQVYKEKGPDGSFKGGPAYYMSKALGWTTMGKIFSFIVVFTFAFAFNTVQANTIAQALDGTFDFTYIISKITEFGMKVGLKITPTSLGISGVIIAILTALVIFGGLKRIAHFSSLIVPVMAIGYVVVAILVLAMNITHIPALVVLIVKSAFGVDAVLGGAMGVAMLQGVKRGLYSNEAGMGSAPNAAATSNVSHPVKQGLMQAFGVFVDTILICSATGFIVLLLPNYANAGETGIKLTQIALSHEVGMWGNPFITVCIFLFAFSSLIGNYYYGETNLSFLLGDNKIYMAIFRILCVITVYIGCVAELSDVWDVADLSMGTMAIMNIVTIAILSPKAFLVIKDYIRQRKEGKNPVFHVKDTPTIVNTEAWDD